MASVGVLTLELRLDDAHSLKDKRHTVKSLKDRLRGKFNVAVAEIDYQDLWQRSLVSAVPFRATTRTPNKCCSWWNAKQRIYWAASWWEAAWSGLSRGIPT